MGYLSGSTQRSRESMRRGGNEYPVEGGERPRQARWGTPCRGTPTGCLTWGYSPHTLGREQCSLHPFSARPASAAPAAGTRSAPEAGEGGATARGGGRPGRLFGKDGIAVAAQGDA